MGLLALQVAQSPVSHMVPKGRAKSNSVGRRAAEKRQRSGESSQEREPREGPPGSTFPDPLRVLPGPSPGGRVQLPQRCAGSWGNMPRTYQASMLPNLSPETCAPAALASLCLPGPCPTHPAARLTLFAGLLRATAALLPSLAHPGSRLSGLLGVAARVLSPHHLRAPHARLSIPCRSASRCRGDRVSASTAESRDKDEGVAPWGAYPQAGQGPLSGLSGAGRWIPWGHPRVWEGRWWEQGPSPALVRRVHLSGPREMLELTRPPTWQPVFLRTRPDTLAQFCAGAQAGASEQACQC